MVILRSANRRALSTRLRALAEAAARATALNGGTSDPAQWMAIAVCSFVRSALARDPRRLTSSKSFANAAPVASGGPENANCLALMIVKGLTLRHCGRTGFAFIGGVGW